MAELTLNTLDQAIDRRYQETNENLKAGKNSSLKVRADSTFHGSTPKVEDAESLPLGVFFPERAGK
jgi:hypothetical protein